MSHRANSRNNLNHLDHDNMSVQSVPHISSHNSSTDNSGASDRPGSRMRAVSIEDLHRSPSRAKTMELTRSRQDLSMIKFVTNSQTRRGAQSELAAARSSSSQGRMSRSREDLRRPSSPGPRPSSRTSMLKEEVRVPASPQIQRAKQPQNILVQRENQENNQRTEMETLHSKVNHLQKENRDLLNDINKLSDAFEQLGEKKDMFERLYNEERENTKMNMEKVKGDRERSLDTNKLMQTTVSKVQMKVDKLELENEELKVSFAVMKAEKHNAISALEAFKTKQQHVTDEISHLYKLNSEQAIRITEFEKEKKLNTEEFAYLYKLKNEQATKIKELERDQKDFSQFHKTISDQAVKISELEAVNKKLEDKCTLQETEFKTQLKEKETAEQTISVELQKLNETISGHLKTIEDLELSMKLSEQKQREDKAQDEKRIAELQHEVEQLRRTTTEQSVKIVDLENNKNEKKETQQANPKKDLLKDISKLKEHYLETINNWKSKYEETKMLLNLRDQELAIYRKKLEKKISIIDDGEFEEASEKQHGNDGIDTVDENETE